MSNWLKKGNRMFWSKVSKYVNIIIVTILLVWNIVGGVWHHRRMMASDVTYYYMYLPTSIIDGDVTCQFLSHRNERIHKYYPFPTQDGKYCSKMTMGTAYMYAPFFLIAHALAEPLGFEPDGFSLIYRLVISLGALVYVFLALHFLRLFLRKYFDTPIVVITLFTLVLGTNLLHYAVREPMMSHVYNFSLFAIFLYLTDKWYEDKRWNIALFLGLVGGIIVLIRPTNAMLAIFFLFYGIKDLNSLRRRWYDFIQHFPQLLLILTMAFIVWIPQFLYWKEVSGQYLFFSYRDESFYFLKPYLLKGLIGFRKGWLLYTPLMFLAIVGLVLSWKHNRKFFWSVGLFLFPFTWVTLSWWCWWYGGSMGARPFVDILPIMAIPLAIFIHFVFQNKKWVKGVGITLLVLFSLKSIQHTIQYQYGGLHFDSETKASYMKNFFKIHPSMVYYNYLRQPDYEGAKFNGLENPNWENEQNQ